jgi:hypothetical protein
MDLIDKYEARRIKQEIGRVLWDVWDPIGVHDIPAAAGEYSGYVNGVYELLVGGASDDEIANALYKIASITMGLGATKEAMCPTVEALRRTRIR